MPYDSVDHYYQTFSHRQMDAWERLRKCPHFQKEQAASERLFERLEANISKEQHDILHEWLEQESAVGAIINDEYYRQGLADGIGMNKILTTDRSLQHMVIEERKAAKKERRKKAAITSSVPGLCSTTV